MPPRPYGVPAMAVIVNLNNPAHYVHWHFFQMSVPNIIAIAVTLAVFAVAIFVRLPSHDAGPDSS